MRAELIDSKFGREGLDEGELKAVYRHFDECVNGVGWLAGVIRVRASSPRAPIHSRSGQNALT